MELLCKEGIVRDVANNLLEVKDDKLMLLSLQILVNITRSNVRKNSDIIPTPTVQHCVNILKGDASSAVKTQSVYLLSKVMPKDAAGIFLKENNIHL